MTVLVTGANGFIGANLVEQLGREHEVVRAVRRGEATEEGSVTRIVGDMVASTEWGQALQNVDVVVHLAALAHQIGTTNIPAFDDYRAVNTAGTVALATQAAAAGVRRFVFMSSIGVIGNRSHSAFTESSACHPHSAYAQSKYQAEIELAEIAQQTGIELVIIRPPLVYGSQAPANFRRLVRLVSKLPITPFGRVKNARSFIAVDHLVDFVELCCFHPAAAGETFLIADDESLSTRQLVDAIAVNLGKRVMQLPCPVSMIRFAASVTGKRQLASQLLDNLEVSNTKAKRLLGWSTRQTTQAAIATCDFREMLV